MVGYEKSLSDAVKALMFKVMKNATAVTGGFFVFTNRTIFKVYLDEDECDKTLESLIINKANVLKYLGRKYIPTTTAKGCIFKDQKCIQKAMIMPDKSVYIHIKNSEPHKIITDTIHVLGILRQEGFEFDNKIKFYIEQVKISIQDVILYNRCLIEFGYSVPSAARVFERQQQKLWGNIEKVIACKKRSIKRKFLRGMVKDKKINWTQLREVLKVTDYNKHSVKALAEKIRAESRALDIKIDF